MGLSAPTGFTIHRENKKGRLFVVSGPSGVGKGTIIRAALSRLTGIALSVSATTREPRPGDIDGVNYHFMSEAEFRSRIEAGLFYEHARYKHNYYGTLRETVDSETSAGTDLILEIDIQGARSVKQLSAEAVLVYMQPPDFASLETRLRGRNTETEEAIKERLQAAVEEQNSIEIDYCGHYVITNSDIEECTDNLVAIIRAERLRLLCAVPHSGTEAVNCR